VYGSPVLKDDVFALPTSGTSSESPTLESGGVASTGEVGTSFFSEFKPPRSPVTRRERRPKRVRVEEASSTDGGLEVAPPRQIQSDRVQAILLRVRSFVIAKVTQGTIHVSNTNANIDVNKRTLESIHLCHFPNVP